jgi:RHH-type rel operon transcriptional repressor/antitoxin RelB
MNTALSIRLPKSMKIDLDKLARTTKRPRSFHIQRALENYIQEFADVRIALDRLRNNQDPVISGRKLRHQVN